MHLTLIIDEHSDPETIARIIAMNMPDVGEAYLLEDDGFGHLSRPEKPIYPKVFDWEESTRVEDNRQEDA